VRPDPAIGIEEFFGPVLAISSLQTSGPSQIANVVDVVLSSHIVSALKKAMTYAENPGGVW